MRWFHGTSGQNAKKILKDGVLKPGQDSVYDVDIPRYDAVYISDYEIAKQYAEERTFRGTEKIPGVVIEVVQPNPKNLMPDEDDVYELLNDRGGELKAKAQGLADRVKALWLRQWNEENASNREYGGGEEQFPDFETFDEAWAAWSEIEYEGSSGLSDQMKGLTDYIVEKDPQLAKAIIQTSGKAAHIGPIKVKGVAAKIADLDEDDDLYDNPVEYFAHSACWLYALALHELTGLPMVSIQEADEKNVEEMGISAVHAAVERDGKLLDSKGEFSLSQIAKRYGLKKPFIEPLKPEAIDAIYGVDDYELGRAKRLAQKQLGKLGIKTAVKKEVTVKTVGFRIEVPKERRKTFFVRPKTPLEYWAFQNRPRVFVNEPLIFTFDRKPVAQAMVVKVEAPGHGEGEYKTWHKVYWKPTTFRRYRAASVISGAWITPEGREYPLGPKEMHGEAAFRLGFITSDELKGESGTHQELINLVMQKGYVRLVYRPGDLLQFECWQLDSETRRAISEALMQNPARNVLIETHVPKGDKWFSSNEEAIEWLQEMTMVASTKDWLYHVTLERNVDDILENGLKAERGGVFFEDIPKSTYLTEKAGLPFWKDEVATQYGEPTVVLKVPRKGLKLVPDEWGTQDAGFPAYRVEQDIPPSKIKIAKRITADHVSDEGFWVGEGGGASGILPVCPSKGTVCLAWRSAEVMEPDCWGTLGGAIKKGMSPAESAKEEMAEETGYSGGVNLIPAFVFTSGSFKYHNFVGVVSSEFGFHPGEGHGWETDHILWVPYQEVVEDMKKNPEDFHPGLLKLFANSGDVIERALGVEKKKQAWQEIAWSEDEGDLLGGILESDEDLKDWASNEFIEENKKLFAEFMKMFKGKRVAVIDMMTAYEAGQGWGSQTLARFIEEAERKGCAAIVLEVGDAPNAFNLKKWYERNGFKQFGKTMELPLMVKWLKPGKKAGVSPTAPPYDITRRPCPSGKRKYYDELSAVGPHRTWDPGTPNLRAYKCPKCGWWHLTSKPLRQPMLAAAKEFPAKLEDWLRAQGGIENLMRGSWEQYEGEARQFAEEDGKQWWQLDDDEINEYLDRAAAEHLKENYPILVSTFNSFKYPLTVYRALKISGEKPHFPHQFGIYWTWVEESAKPYEAKGEGATIIYRGEVRKDAIDWQQTMRLNLDHNIGEEENEIRLKPGATINLTGIRKADETEWRDPAPLKQVTAAKRKRYYHVSSTFNRSSIEKNGLQPQIKEFKHVPRPAGVYVFDSFEDAANWAYDYWHEFAAGMDEIDIWEVKIDPEKLKPDTHGQVENGFYTDEAVPPKDIKLVDTLLEDGGTHMASKTAKFEQWMKPWLTGKCWEFAIALSHRIPDTEFVALARDDGTVEHVGLRRGGKFYDVRGEMGEDEFNYGADSEVPLHIEPIDLDQVLRDGGFPSWVGHEDEFNETSEMKDAEKAVGKAFGTKVAKKSPFWFAEGFDPKIKSFILKHRFPDEGMSCYDECYRWAKLLLSQGYDVELYEGNYTGDMAEEGDEYIGHTWLAVNGSLFDPTAGQFDSEPDTAYYEEHDIKDADELKRIFKIKSAAAHTPEFAQNLIEALKKTVTDADFKVVGSVGMGGTSENDLDILVNIHPDAQFAEDQPWSESSGLIGAMKLLGFDLIDWGGFTPEESAEKSEESGKYLDPSGSGIEKFFNPDTHHTVEFWFTESGMPKEADWKSKYLLPTALALGLGAPVAPGNLTPQQVKQEQVERQRIKKQEDEQRRLSDLVQAISRAEGADPDLNNPGNIKDFNTGEIKKFDTLEQGRKALEEQLERIADGDNPFISPDMSLREAGLIYSNGDPNWAKNVSLIMHVPESIKMKQLIKGRKQVAKEPAQSTNKNGAWAKKAAGFAFKSFRKLWHVGTMNQKNKQPGSLEGSGLSVSQNPEEWREIARIGGDTWELTKPGNKFLNFHRMSQPQRKQITAWGVANGYVEEVAIGWRYVYHDEETNEERYMEFATEQEARDEMESMGEGEVVPAKGSSMKGTNKLKKRTMNPRADDMVVAFDLLVTVYADEELDCDGIWWQDIYDPAGLSAPRGVIFADKLGGWKARKMRVASSPNIYSPEEVEEYFKSIHGNEYTMKFDEDYVLRDVPIKDLRSFTNMPGDNPRVKAYVKRYNEGSPFPPVIVSKTMDVRDGSHRISAAMICGQTKIPAFIPVGAAMPRTAAEKITFKEQEPIAKDYEGQVPDKSLMMYLDGQEIGGIGWLILHNHKGEKFWEIVDSYVMPEWRGKGYGKQMYKALFAHAKKSGVPYVISDEALSPDAEGVWESLKREGIAEEEDYGYMAKTAGIKLPTFEQVVDKKTDTNNEFDLGDLDVWKDRNLGNMRDYYDEAVQKLRNLRFPLTVYRCFALREGDKIDYAQLGGSWSLSSRAAYLTVHGMFDDAEYENYPVIAGTIASPDQVNWLDTTRAWMTLPEEEEIRLKPGAKVKVKGKARTAAVKTDIKELLDLHDTIKAENRMARNLGPHQFRSTMERLIDDTEALHAGLEAYADNPRVKESLEVGQKYAAKAATMLHDENSPPEYATSWLDSALMQYHSALFALGHGTHEAAAITYLYHGTTDDNLANILANGITAPSYWGTAEMADYFAKGASEESGNSIIFKLPMSRFDKSKFAVDKVAVAEPITTVLGRDDEELYAMWEQAKGTWQDSLRIYESVKYEAPIKVSENDIF